MKWFLLIFGVIGGIVAAVLHQHSLQAVIQTKPVGSNAGSPVTQPRSARSNRTVHIHPGNGNADGAERF